MKKIFMVICLGVFMSMTVIGQSSKPKIKMESAQGKIKAKPKTTTKQKIHNLVHPKRKQSSGIKLKAKGK
ncbi:MAG: hypothetical protein NVSMB67_28200 [Flavisolibacter sp.]